MAIIDSSEKLSGGGNEYQISAGRTVFFRFVTYPDRAEFVTATTGEHTKGLKAYHNQPELIRIAENVFAENEIPSEPDEDRQKRPFVRTVTESDESFIKRLATVILDRLGIEGDIWVQAVRDLRELHAEFAVSDDEDAYLMDKMVITPDGRIVQT